MRRQDSDHLQTILAEAITVLCKASLTYRIKFAVEGLLAVTLDDEDIFLVNIQETVLDEARKTSTTKNGGEVTSQPSSAAGGEVPAVDLSSQKHHSLETQESPIKQDLDASSKSNSRNKRAVTEQHKASSNEPSHRNIGVKNERTDEDHLYGNSVRHDALSEQLSNSAESHTHSRKRNSTPSSHSKSESESCSDVPQKTVRLSLDGSLSGSDVLDQNGLTMSEDEPLDYSAMHAKKRRQTDTTSLDISEDRVMNVKVKKEDNISDYKHDTTLLSPSHNHMLDLASQWLSASMPPMIFPPLQPDLFKSFHHPELLLSSFAVPDAKHRWADLPKKESDSKLAGSSSGSSAQKSSTLNTAAFRTRPQGFVCDTCGASFSNHSNLENHRWTHNRGAYRCKLCAKSFKSPNYLYQHNKYVHIQGKFYPCSLCPKRFVKKQNLRIHMTRHHQGVYHFYESTPSQQGNRVSVQSAYHLQNGEVHTKSLSLTDLPYPNSLEEHPIMVENGTDDRNIPPTTKASTNDMDNEPIMDSSTSADSQEPITETVANT